MIRPFHFWCQKVLPLVYDDSLSYYEVLCKLSAKLNEIITELNKQGEAIEDLQEAVKQIQEWIDNFDTSYIADLIEKYLAGMIYVGISDAGYIVYYIPESWSAVTFRTTGLDIKLDDFPEYGHLVLNLWNIQPVSAGTSGMFL